KAASACLSSDTQRRRTARAQAPANAALTPRRKEVKHERAAAVPQGPGSRWTFAFRDDARVAAERKGVRRLRDHLGAVPEGNRIPDAETAVGPAGARPRYWNA